MWACGLRGTLPKCLSSSFTAEMIPTSEVGLSNHLNARGLSSRLPQEEPGGKPESETGKGKKRINQVPMSRLPQQATRTQSYRESLKIHVEHASGLLTRRVWKLVY